MELDSKACAPDSELDPYQEMDNYTETLRKAIANLNTSFIEHMQFVAQGIPFSDLGHNIYAARMAFESMMDFLQDQIPE